MNRLAFMKKKFFSWMQKEQNIFATSKINFCMLKCIYNLSKQIFSESKAIIWKVLHEQFYCLCLIKSYFINKENLEHVKILNERGKALDCVLLRESESIYRFQNLQGDTFSAISLTNDKLFKHIDNIMQYIVDCIKKI